MREIKFRAWDAETRKMWKVEGLKFDHLDGLGTTDVMPPAEDWDGEWPTTQEVVLMQSPLKDKNGGGGGSRTRVRKCYWSRDYMLIRVHAPGITLGRSRPPLRTDKKRVPLA
jgi:hypothetical protein